MAFMFWNLLKLSFNLGLHISRESPKVCWIYTYESIYQHSLNTVFGWWLKVLYNLKNNLLKYLPEKSLMFQTRGYFWGLQHLYHKSMAQSRLPDSIQVWNTGFNILNGQSSHLPGELNFKWQLAIKLSWWLISCYEMHHFYWLILNQAIGHVIHLHKISIDWHQRNHFR